MSRWNDTYTTLKDESTFSEDVITSRENVVVCVDMDVNEKVVNTSNLESDQDSNLGKLEDGTWEESHGQDVEMPKIQVFDIAAYILERIGTMTTMKLQKLVYYSQAWALVWDEQPLFEESIEAWANGPVVRDLFDYHRGMYEISAIPIGNPRLLNEVQQETIDAVLEYYADKSAQWLIELTHMEDPWIRARKGLPPLERGNRVIPLDTMADYYSSLPVEDNGEDEE